MRNKLLDDVRHCVYCSHAVNLLTSMPRVSYEEMLAPIGVDESRAEGGAEVKDTEYDGKNMEAIVALLEFLDRRLDSVCFEFLMKWRARVDYYLAYI